MWDGISFPSNVQHDMDHLQWDFIPATPQMPDDPEAGTHTLYSTEGTLIIHKTYLTAIWTSNTKFTSDLHCESDRKL